MGSLITYSAIAAKLAAMRGHFLTDDEFSVLAGMENVPAAVEYLKSSPAYRDVFAVLFLAPFLPGGLDDLVGLVAACLCLQCVTAANDISLVCPDD